jgi:hypothetical protein
MKTFTIAGALALAVAYLPGCRTTSHPDAVLYFRDGTQVECPRGLEFGDRWTCHTERGTVTVPWNDVARYELR